MIQRCVLVQNVEKAVTAAHEDVARLEAVVRFSPQVTYIAQTQPEWKTGRAQPRPRVIAAEDIPKPVACVDVSEEVIVSGSGEHSAAPARMTTSLPDAVRALRVP